MTASQANQTQSLNMFFYISGSATRSWLLLGPSFSKTSKTYKSSIWDILCYTHNYTPFLNGISFLALNFSLCLNNLRCCCLPPTYQCALRLDVVGFQLWHKLDLPLRPSHTWPFFILDFSLEEWPEQPENPQSPLTLLTWESLKFIVNHSPLVVPCLGYKISRTRFLRIFYYY